MEHDPVEGLFHYRGDVICRCSDAVGHVVNKLVICERDLAEREAAAYQRGKDEERSLHGCASDKNPNDAAGAQP